MNIIKAFNQSIDYIETVLDDTIDTNKIVAISGYSYAMFSRLFSILTNIPLSKYIRNRRLSEAAIQLRDTNDKIIDIAMKFGYESSDAFGSAFKHFHGFTPSEIRNGQSFKSFSRIQLSLTVQGGQIMNHTNKERTIINVTTKNIQECLCATHNTQSTCLCQPGQCQCQTNHCDCYQSGQCTCPPDACHCQHEQCPCHIAS